MADSKTLSTKGIKTSPAGSMKHESINMHQAAKKADAAANAEVAKVAVNTGEVRYGTMGTSDFSVEGIRFGAATYVCSDPKEQEILDSCVKRQLLVVVEDKRK